MQNAMLNRRPNFMYTIKQLCKNTHPYGLAWNETQGSEKLTLAGKAGWCFRFSNFLPCS